MKEIDFYPQMMQDLWDRRELLTKKQMKEIEKTYKRLSAKAEYDLLRGTSSLSESDLRKYMHNLKKEIKIINLKIGKTTKETINDLVGDFTSQQASFFNDLNSKYGWGMGTSFNALFDSIATRSIEEIVSGNLYKDGLGLSQRLWKNIGKETNDIQDIITQGIGQHKSSTDLAKDLVSYLNPNQFEMFDPDIDKLRIKKQVQYVTQRLARTSIHHAYQSATIRSTRNNPFVDGVKWHSAHGQRTCTLCSERDGQFYSNAEGVPLEHPNGRCTLIPVVERSLDSIAQEVGAWTRGGANSRLDNWFNEYGIDFIR